jgi:uncharacterized protein
MTKKTMILLLKTLFFLRKIVGVTLLAWGFAAQAQELVRYSAADTSTDNQEISGLLTLPKLQLANGAKYPAVILHHAGGGWETPVTSQYAKALNDAGFATLEPRLFRNPQERKPSPSMYISHMYGGLQYLASRSDIDPSKIGVSGFSNGGYLALVAATSWSVEKWGGKSNLKFAAHAPFYPVCWAHLAIMKGNAKVPTMPAEAYTKWTGAPTRIFAGGLDDYDDRDPKACDEFVSELNPASQSAFTVKVYPSATHGWDQPSGTWYEKNGCKGRGCTNRNVYDAQVTGQSILDLVEFMKNSLR